MTAILTDAEAASGEINGAEWKWEKSRSRSSGWTAIDGAGAENMYYTRGGHYRLLPAGDGCTYDDTDDNEKTAQAVSVNKVREAPATTDEDPTFPAAPPSDRSVDENSPAGTRWASRWRPPTPLTTY